MLWSLVGAYVMLIVLLHIPAIQAFVGDKASAMLAAKLGTKVRIGSVCIGLPGHLVIDRVDICDQRGGHMLRASRISAGVEILPLFYGRISISSAQLFGMNATLYKDSANAKTNFQFVIDSLSSKTPTAEKRPFDLNIHSLIIRNGIVRYDQKDIAPTLKHFNTAHIYARNISSHIILNRLTNDTISINCKRLSAEEQSGLILKSLSFRFDASRTMARLADLHIELPSTKFRMRQISATYTMTEGKMDMPSLMFDGEIDESKVTPSDLSSFIPALRTFTSPLSISSSFYGTSSSIRVKKLRLMSTDNSLNLIGDGSLTMHGNTPRWFVRISSLSLDAATISFLSRNLKGQSVTVPAFVTRLGDACFHGRAGGEEHDLSVKGSLNTDAGNAGIAFAMHDKHFSSNLKTDNLNLRTILDNTHFGSIAADLAVKGQLGTDKISRMSVKGRVGRIDYNDYSYRNISINGIYDGDRFNGDASIDDPNGKLAVSGMMALHGKRLEAKLKASARDIQTAALKLSKRNIGISADLSVDFEGTTINDAKGFVCMNNLSVKGVDIDYRLDEMNVRLGYAKRKHFLEMKSDFGNAVLYGVYDYKTVARSVTNLVASKLPTLPGLPALTDNVSNSFSLKATVNRTDWLNALFGTDIHANQPISLYADIDDRTHRMDVRCDMPAFTWNDNAYENGVISISTPNDTLRAESSVRRINSNGGKLDMAVMAFAADNHMTTNITVNDNKPHGLNGTMKLDARFWKSDKGLATASVNVLPSSIYVGDTVWHVRPSEVTYRKGYLDINDFAIEHNQQHIRLSGMATANGNDSVTADLHDVDVAYILNLVNFHSVDFSGKASGTAVVKSLFTNPNAYARLDVEDFLFENGEMGTLHAKVEWDKDDNRINIDALADDGEAAKTKIDGYVSLKESYIDLSIKAMGTKLQFMETFCSSFMRDVDAHGTGHIKVFGPLKAVNMEGNMVVDGNIGISSLNTTYKLNHSRIMFEPDNIIFNSDTISDRNGNIGIVNGRVTHNHLSKFAYDIDINARNMLAYDFTEYGDNSYYGTVYATGKCSIQGESGEVNIDVNVTPQRGSFLEYNVVSPEAISRQEFITWNDQTPSGLRKDGDSIVKEQHASSFDLASDMRINFMINSTPDLTLRLLMDSRTGDKITLNGNGTIRATYYNKGAFQIFGNYMVDHGTYKLTIQNLIKKEFTFLQGSTIAFGGNPYDAAINLKAQYTVNGVSLSDLNFGKSFSGNTIKVNCLMNISGTPDKPHIDFGLELPTLSTDAEQMIRSLMNSEEETNQQVLYLLAVGRFYNSGNNNAREENAEQQSQTTLAMQSILSGNISQQINSVLSTLINSGDWNFGANISTGDEGWSNAEYEGLLSGKMFNNRLLFNGQFGYRDNPNAQTNFIGDFDIKYLIYPNGNLAINIYNQTNDRYFTRNSLNTQGIGIIMKKDFKGWRDLFGIRKRKDVKRKSKK